MLLISSVFSVQANEGMFMPFKLKQFYKEMKNAGLAISYKKIYNEKKPSIKDAIVSLGGFCTAEIISSKGLMLTNHHCGYDAIRENSTPEHDYLTDGFWAMKTHEEKPIPGLTASIVVKIEDVTEIVLGQLGNAALSEGERSAKIREIYSNLEADAMKDSNYKVYIKAFFGGNEFYMFTTEVFNDVRLVGAPPSSIGKYGGDTDNWMWTRHTGDFSMFRIYANKENKPAVFAMDNVPYKPKHHLPVSIKGVENGDYTMIMGYPGTTDRYLTSFGVKMAIEKDQPSRVKARAEKLDIMRKNMKSSDAIRIQYASSYAQVSNYWKYFIGQTEQLKKNKVFHKKAMIEEAFQVWYEKNEDRKKKYGNVLTDMERSYRTLEKYNSTQVYFYEAIYSIGYNQFLLSHKRLYKELTKEEVSKESIAKLMDYYKKNSETKFAEMDLTTEKKLVSNLLKMFVDQVPNTQYSKELLSVYQKNKGDIPGFVEKSFQNSIFGNEKKYNAFLENPTKEKMADDKLFLLVCDLMDKYREVMGDDEMVKAHGELSQANRLFIAALREMNPDKKYYPNANSTLRLTYGNVGRYKKGDGLLYDFYTTIDGLMAKEDATNDEFIVPAKLKELYKKKDYGRYGQDGTLRVNFISNNDITGGNSGSPVINAEGHLIGCAFDGNWEAMSGDIAFEKELQRTISVDIRYILFVIDKYAGATNLIDEMTIVE